MSEFGGSLDEMSKDDLIELQHVVVQRLKKITKDEKKDFLKQVNSIVKKAELEINKLGEDYGYGAIAVNISLPDYMIQKTKDSS
jgi:hypothetical protein